MSDGIGDAPSLWDWYAKEALKLLYDPGHGLVGRLTEGELARRAGAQADAMVAERRRRGAPDLGGE